jgi:hypothetical protein
MEPDLMSEGVDVDFARCCRLDVPWRRAAAGDAERGLSARAVPLRALAAERPADLPRPNFPLRPFN